MVKRAAIRSPLRRIALYPGSTLGESSLPSTTFRQIMLSAVPKGESCGRMKRNRTQRRRSGWISGTSTITMLNPSGSRICISLNPHGLSVGSSIISTPVSSSSCPTASTSRTCNHRPTLSLAPVREEPDSSRKPPPRKKTTPLWIRYSTRGRRADRGPRCRTETNARSRWNAPTPDSRELP